MDDDSLHRATSQQMTSGRETPATNDCRRENESEAELLDVLGIGGYIALVQPIQHVPDGFLTYRYQYMANILTIATKTEIQASDVKRYVDMLSESNTSIAAGKLPVDLLWRATFEYDFPHTVSCSASSYLPSLCGNIANSSRSIGDHLLHPGWSIASC